MITGNLEYLLSSLPYLSFQNTEEVRLRVTSIFKKYAGSSEEEEKDLVAILDGEAAKFLSTNRRNLLDQIDLETIHNTTFQKSNNTVLSAFSKYAFSIKEAIKQLRISRRDNQNTSKKASQIIVPGHPLDEEIQLLKLKWNKLEALAVGHDTDFAALIIYKLKLMLLLKWWGFDADKGYQVFLQTIKKD